MKRGDVIEYDGYLGIYIRDNVFFIICGKYQCNQNTTFRVNKSFMAHPENIKKVDISEGSYSETFEKYVYFLRIVSHIEFDVENSGFHLTFPSSSVDFIIKVKNGLEKSPSEIVGLVKKSINSNFGEAKIYWVD